MGLGGEDAALSRALSHSLALPSPPSLPHGEDDDGDVVMNDRQEPGGGGADGEGEDRARTLAGKILVQLGAAGGGGLGVEKGGGMEMGRGVQRAVGRSALGYMGLVVAYGTMEAEGEEEKCAMLERVWEAWFDELFDVGQGHSAAGALGVGVWESGWGGSVWEVLSHPFLFIL